MRLFASRETFPVISTRISATRLRSLLGGTDGRLAIRIAEPPAYMLGVKVEIHFKNDPNGKMYRAVCLKTISKEVPGQPGQFMTQPNEAIRRLFGGNPMRNLRKTADGFTLIEVIVAFTISRCLPWRCSWPFAWR